MNSDSLAMKEIIAHQSVAKKKLWRLKDERNKSTEAFLSALLKKDSSVTTKPQQPTTK